MQRYIVKRVGEAILALFALSIIIFLMVRMTGDPALLMLPPDAGADALEDIRHSMGLDKPLVVQYGLFIRDYAHGSFGDSLRSKTPVSELVKAAWASASTYRNSDHRGGANGARVRLAPQKDWAVNDPDELSKVLSKLDELRGDLSIADAIVLAGAAAIEKAAKDGGHDVSVDVTTGRGDAGDEHTDAESFEPLEPFADGFRNYLKTKASVKTEDMLIDRAHLLGLSIPEMTALVGGMRALGAVSTHAKHGNSIGVLTDRPGTLSNDFFVNLLEMGTVWEVVDESGDEEFVGKCRIKGDEKWRATRTDLVFGSNSQLRAVAETYAEKGGEERMVRDFVKAWTKVMDADRFDLRCAKYHK